MSRQQREIPTDTVIVGAGLAGLASAFLLSKMGGSVSVLEARGRIGGRIKSVYDESSGAYLADLGPTWIWPAHQPVISRWLEILALRTYPQFNEGHAIFDIGPGSTPERRGGFDDGSIRIEGGPQALIDRLAERLPRDTIHKNVPVNKVTVTSEHVEIEVTGENERTIVANRLIIALPPRLAAKAISWNPSVPLSLDKLLSGTPTWMAPHAKAVMAFDRPFWRDEGLSGRIASRHGPLVEVHDHSNHDGSSANLFGFIGWPHNHRETIGNAINDEIRDQLKRCFGQSSPEPVGIFIKDWAFDALTTTEEDLAGPASHPGVMPDLIRNAHFSDRVWFANAETAALSPGLIEGAFVAAENIAREFAGRVTSRTDH